MTAISLVLAGALFFGPTQVGADPVEVARRFMAAVHDGKTQVITEMRTDDALFIGGHVAVPMAGSETIFERPEIRQCTVGPLQLASESFERDAFGPQTPPSIRTGFAKRIKGTLSCPLENGATHTTKVTLAVLGNRIALFAFGTG